MDFPAYSIVIPAYNAQEFIGSLLDYLKSIPVKPQEVFVIDDGSTDNTASIAKQKNASVYSLNFNRGKGFALKKGFELFIKNSKSKYVLCMDADLQHSTEPIFDLLSVAVQKNCSVIMGNRNISTETMPFLRYLSNRMTSAIISLITGRKIQDSQCGFRLIKRDVIASIDLKESGFQLESEFILKCAEKNIAIEFVDIPTIYNNTNSNIRHFQDTFSFIWLIVKEIYKKWSMKKNAN